MEARKIIITGGATRIGAAIAKKLSGKNVEIVIHFNKSRTKAIALKKELEKTGTKIYLVKGNLNKEEDIRKIIKSSKKYLKYFDCLINNASMFENDKLENFSSESWNKHLNINLKAPAILTREFAKNIKGKNNNVINIIDQRVSGRSNRRNTPGPIWRPPVTWTLLASWIKIMCGKRVFFCYVLRIHLSELNQISK